MRPPARLASCLLAALILPAGLAPAIGQKPPPSNAPDFARPPTAAPFRPPASVAAQAPGQEQTFEAGVAEEELRTTADDPPIVVGRIARTVGSASIRPPGEEEWQPAGLNTSITQGTAIWTEQGGRVALEVAQSRLFLDGNSAVQLDELDEDGMRATLAQGSGFLRLQGIGTDDGLVEVATPEATLATVVDGRYLIEAAAQDGSRPGRIAVFEGVAEITPVGAEPIRLGAGEALILAPGAAPQRVAAGAASPLMAWALAAEPRRAVPLATRGMTGISELATQGNWGAHAEYGDVWYPPVQQDWQPYRDGSWQWREPWGWTWVDAAPWGYAPAHYGRWVQIGPRWAWAPQPVRVSGWQVRPAWSPALVAFFGGVAVGSARPVGWVPLGPREPFYPWYRASPRYVQRVNYRQVTNVAVVRNVWVERGGRDFRWDDDRRGDAGRARFHDRRLDQFRNHRAAIQVPERVMLSSQSVRNESRRLRFEDARRAELHGGLPLRPALDTRGVTPRQAERLGYSPAQIRGFEPRDRANAPPPAVRAALADRRRDDARDRAEAQRDAARDRGDAQRDAARDRGDAQRDAARDAARRDAARDAAQRDAARDRGDPQRDAARDRTDAQRDAARDSARREPGREPTGRAPDGSGRQALRERLVQQQREAGDPARAAQDAQRAEAQRQQEQLRQQQRQARPSPGEQRRQPGEETRQQQPDQARQQQQQQQQQREQARGQQQDQARQQQRQQQEQARSQQQEQARQQQQQQREQARSQQQEQARQQQQQQREQARSQQQDQARQQQQQQREQARSQQQEQARQQQQQQREQARSQQQEQARQQQQQQREQARSQQQEQARQQQEQARRQQQDQMRQQQEQARRQQQDQARQQQQQQQEQARRQQQDQARQQQQQQQQEQARRQQQDQARQQQAEQRRQERQR